LIFIDNMVKLVPHLFVSLVGANSHALVNLYASQIL
jgi:hypothetical protein